MINSIGSFRNNKDSGIPMAEFRLKYREENGKTDQNLFR